MKTIFASIITCIVIINVQAQGIWSGVLSSSENEKAVLANVHDTLYKIHDGVWQKMNYLSSTDLVDIKIDNQNNIWVFYANEIKKSNDNGLTWSSLSKPSDAGSIGEICGNYVYLKFSQEGSWSGNKKIYRKNYTLNNDTWKMLYEGKDITTTADGTIYISLYERNIIKSTNDGVTWTNTKWAAVGEFSTPGEINSKDNKLYVGTYWGGCYTSSDGGETWVKSQGLPSNRGISHILLINNRVYALVKDQQKVFGFYVSEDDGLNFTKLNTGFSFFVEQSIDGFSGKGNNLFISTGARGFNKSTDNGLTWNEFNNGHNNIFPHDILRIQMDNSGAVWTLLGWGNGPNSPTWGVFKSADNGKTWTDNSIGLYDDYQTLEDMVVTPNGTAYVSGYNPGSIFKSTDLGKTWIKLKVETNTIPPSIQGNAIYSTVYIIKSNGTNDTIYGCTRMNGIIRTFDGGQNWTSVNPSFAYDISIIKDTVYAILFSNNSYDGIYKSINNGDTWIKKNSQVLQKIIRQDNVLYGTNQNRVYKSIDDGTTWVDISSNLPTNLIINSIISTKSNGKTVNKYLVISTSEGVFSSKSAEANWQKISSFPNKPICWDFINEELIIGSDYKLLVNPIENFNNTINFNVIGSNGTLTAKVDGATIVSGSMVMLEKTVIFTAIPAFGYRVKEWKLNGNVIPGHQMNNYSLSNISSSASVSVEFILATDIDLQDIDEKTIKFYPNPFSSFIKVINATDYEKIELIEISGQVRLQLFSNGKEEITIHTDTLPKGVYILQASNSKGRITTKKFIKL